jgi:hypothetical protein
MGIKRTLKTLAGVLLILVFASGAQAATVVIHKTGFRHGTETGFEILAPFGVPVPDILKGIKVVASSPLGSGMFKFQTDPVISTADVNKVTGGGAVLSMPRLSDLGLSKLKLSDEPVPTIALLILVGVIALIALKGRRK